MAEKITLDDGVLELEINDNGVLHFNPSDPNVYQRFLTLAQELPEMEKQYVQAEIAQGDEMAQAEDILGRMKEIDAGVKRKLAEVFGTENDFDVLLGGVSLMAVGRNGERVVTNLLNALAPYMEKGIKQHMRDAAADAVSEAKAARAKRKR